MKSTFSFLSATPKTPETLVQSTPASSKENSSLTFFKHFLAVYNWICLLNTPTDLKLTLSALPNRELDLAKNHAADFILTEDPLKLMMETEPVVKPKLTMSTF